MHTTLIQLTITTCTCPFDPFHFDSLAAGRRPPPCRSCHSQWPCNLKSTCECVDPACPSLACCPAVADRCTRQWAAAGCVGSGTERAAASRRFCRLAPGAFCARLSARQYHLQAATFCAVDHFEGRGGAGGLHSGGAGTKSVPGRGRAQPGAPQWSHKLPGMLQIKWTWAGRSQEPASSRCAPCKELLAAGARAGCKSASPFTRRQALQSELPSIAGDN